MITLFLSSGLDVIL